MRLRHVLAAAAAGFWRNVTMTTAMVITMAVSLALLGVSLLLYLQVDTMRDIYLHDVEVTVFLDMTDATPGERTTVGVALADDPLVDTATFETSAQSYARFQAAFAGAPELLAQTRPESLPDTYRVKLIDPTRFDEFNAHHVGRAGIDRIVDQASLIEEVFSILGSLQTLTLIIAGAQGVAALMLVINVIQVAAYHQRREVAVMRLVGASNWFILAPFVLEAVAAGVVGAVLAYGVLVLAKVYVFDGTLAPLTAVLTPVPWLNVHLMLPALSVTGALVSAVIGWAALRFYVRV